jgi:DNA mismatch repair protein MutL
MGTIRLLPELVANKIAAGEVVERPSSVVKELVENALDAHATRITISIRHGGKSFIKVVDNGHGMDREDAELCFERHATSKIKDSEDIFSIESLGFRGEALPSIASVSRLVLQTKTPSQELGMELSLIGGRRESIKEKGMPDGTSITVSDLFFNTPARKKFLKGEKAEYVSIAETVTTISLAYPHVAFKLSKDDEVQFDYPSCSHLQERLLTTHHREWVKHLLPLHVESGEVTMSGYIAKAELSRTNRTAQFFFINRRPVKSLPLSYALQRAYDGLLPQRHFPVAIILLGIDPGTVDVNIHPTKREVRLQNERGLQDQLTRCVREMVATSDHAPHLSFAYSLDREKTYAPRPSGASPTFRELKETVVANRTYPETAQDVLPSHQGAMEPEASFSCDREKRLNVKALIGQIGESYILAETEEGLVILDQHAVHERIIFEAIVDALDQKTTPSQPLLLPVTIELSFKEAQLLEEHLDILTRVGFGINHLGKNTFLVDATPAWLGNVEVTGVVHSFLQEIREGKGERPLGDRREHTAKILACKSYTVKAHKKLSHEEMNHLIERLEKTKQPFTCPHGRPTLIKLTLDDLARQFKRT